MTLTNEQALHLAQHLFGSTDPELLALLHDGIASMPHGPVFALPPPDAPGGLYYTAEAVTGHVQSVCAAMEKEYDTAYEALTTRAQRVSRLFAKLTGATTYGA